jgi:hypothetical protein
MPSEMGVAISSASGGGLDRPAVAISSARPIIAIMANRPHPEQGFRTCLGVMRLFRAIDPTRSESVAAYALSIGAHVSRSIAAIIATKRDQAATDGPPAERVYAMPDVAPLSKIPSDNYIRDMLDLAALPELLHPVFDQAVGQLTQIPGALTVFRRLGGHTLIALDGTQCRASATVRRLRTVVIELGMWRVGRIGGASGSITLGNSRYFERFGGIWS